MEVALERVINQASDVKKILDEQYQMELPIIENILSALNELKSKYDVWDTTEPSYRLQVNEIIDKLVAWKKLVVQCQVFRVMRASDDEKQDKKLADLCKKYFTH